MIAVITTFPNASWEVYSKSMMQSFTKHWPEEIPLLIQLDDDLIYDMVGKQTRPQDAISVGWEPEHKAFVERNKGKDDPTNYRHQVTRFCHKVFAINRAYEAVKKQREAGPGAPRYLIWMDADVITNRPVTMEDIKKCLPKEGEAVSYLGRKDWPHSECGWLAFDLENGGSDVIEVMHGLYTSDAVLSLKETHDSWVFDHIRKSEGAPPMTNLTEGKPGMDIWAHSPMAAWSTHYKGPVAKAAKAQPQNMIPGNTGGGIVINTKNAIPDEQIRAHIAENQKLIKNWVRPCAETDEEIVVVSAGPQLVPEDVLPHYEAGQKIVAVKHALGPLKSVGIKPWASILLDPRPHVANFVEDADPDVIWFVASQVNPQVTMKLLAAGCTVWGYHASVNAGEEKLTSLQKTAIINGGSATATRGWHLLKHLGFSKFMLYGYDLCYPDKPDLEALDELKQPKFIEMSVGWSHPLNTVKKCFWTEPQLVAQFQEIHALIQNNTFKLRAKGEGIVPFILNSKALSELREKRLNTSMGKLLTHEELLCNKKKKTSSLTKLLPNWRKIRRKTT